MKGKKIKRVIPLHGERAIEYKDGSVLLVRAYSINGLHTNVDDLSSLALYKEGKIQAFALNRGGTYTKEKAFWSDGSISQQIFVKKYWIETREELEKMPEPGKSVSVVLYGYGQPCIDGLKNGSLMNLDENIEFVDELNIPTNLESQDLI